MRFIDATRPFRRGRSSVIVAGALGATLVAAPTTTVDAQALAAAAFDVEHPAPPGRAAAAEPPAQEAMVTRITFSSATHDLVYRNVDNSLYVSLPTYDRVAVVSMASRTVSERLSVDGFPRGLALSGDERLLHAGVKGDALFASLDLETGDVSRFEHHNIYGSGDVEEKAGVVFVAGEGTSSLVSVDTGTSTMRRFDGRMVGRGTPIVAHPTTSRVYAKDYGRRYLLAFDAADPLARSVPSTFDTGVAPFGGYALSPDGDRVYLDTGAVISSTTLEQVATVGPGLPAVSPDGAVVYALGDGPRGSTALSAWDTGTGVRRWALNVGCGGDDITVAEVLPDGRTIVALAGRTVCIIDLPEKHEGVIFGQATGHANGVEGIPDTCVEIYDASAPSEDAPVPAHRTLTGPKGWFAVAVPAGAEYVVQTWDCTDGVHGTTYHPQVPSYGEATRLRPLAGGVVDASTHMRPAAEFAGTVVDEATGRPIEGVEVLVIDSSGVPINWYGVTDRQGRWWVPGIWSQAVMTVLFIDPEGRFAGEYFDDRAVAGSATPVVAPHDDLRVGIDAALGPPGVLRLWGPDRLSTAVSIATAVFEPSVPVAYVATAGSFPDALSGGPVAAVGGGPVLLTAGSSLPDATAAQLRRLRPGRIVVLGGRKAIADAVLRDLRSLTVGPVTRVSGLDRFETAAAVSRSVFEPGVATAYVATGDDFPDALAGGPVAAREGAPILLTRSRELPQPTIDELRRLRPGRIVVIGGEGVVSRKVARELRSLTAGGVSRLSGSDRSETAAEISASAFAPGVPTAFVATGADFPDALAGGPVAGLIGGPILLAARDELPQATRRELMRLRPRQIAVLGGRGVLSSKVLVELGDYVVRE